MNNEHTISDEVLDSVNLALSKDQHWMAYNNSLYFIDNNDVHFFSDKISADEFATNNISDRDSFCVMHFDSVQDILTKIPYGERINKLLVCNPDANGLYNPEGNAFTDALLEHFEQQQLSSSNSKLKTNIMNNENLQYLKDNLKYMGFGEKQNESLESHLKEGKEAFQLTFNAEINQKTFEASLTFRKSDSSDMYFFNSYNASLERKTGEKVNQTFYLNKGKGVTAKEAFNLLDGRAVFKELANKEGQTYNAWVQLDFNNKDKNNNHEVKQYHENYGYDLKAAVSKFAISELNDGEKEKALMQSLQKGNIQSVTVEKDGSAHKMFIEANPQYKTANLYDGQMKRVQKESLESYQSTSQNKEQIIRPERQQDIKPETKVEKQSMKKGKSQKDGLLPKKKNRPEKGLSVS